ERKGEVGYVLKGRYEGGGYGREGGGGILEFGLNTVGVDGMFAKCRRENRG
ncbi:GNAT family N-acetyltransferase, partial [Paenibacillus xylanexedens]|uniref:GNAT family N-acetyltransferase n=1 Tax=Paenibacillus xylanexedens TaxID=528191 RepID=UPI0011A7371D